MGAPSMERPPAAPTAEKRFALYQPGMPVAAYKAAVGSTQALADLRWDAKKGFIRIEAT